MSTVCFFQAEDGIRDLVRSRGLGDVYKRQDLRRLAAPAVGVRQDADPVMPLTGTETRRTTGCLSLIHI